MAEEHCKMMHIHYIILSSQPHQLYLYPIHHYITQNLPVHTQQLQYTHDVYYVNSVYAPFNQ